MSQYYIHDIIKILVVIWVNALYMLLLKWEMVYVWKPSI